VYSTAMLRPSERCVNAVRCGWHNPEHSAR